MGEGTRTLDIQLGSNRLLFELEVSEERLWIAIFVVLPAGSDLVA